MSTNVSVRRLDIRSAADHSGRSIATIRRRIADGSLPAYWEDNKQVVEVSDLDAVFASHRVVPKSGDTDLDALVKRTVAAWPRMTPAQRDLVVSMGRAE